MGTNDDGVNSNFLGHLKPLHFVILGVSVLALLVLGYFLFTGVFSSDDSANPDSSEFDENAEDEYVVLQETPESVLTDEEIEAGRLLDESPSASSLEQSRSDAEAAIEDDPSIENISALIGVCIQQEDIECLESQLETVAQQDRNLGILLKENIADLYAAQGDIDTARQLIDEIIADLQANGVEGDGGDFDPIQYYQDKKSSYGQEE